MTRTRFIVRLAIVVMAAAVVLGIQLLVRHVSDEPAGRAEPDIRRVFEIDDPELISSVEMENADRILSFEREEIPAGAYRESGVDIVLSDRRIPARADRFEAFVETMYAMERESFVTENPERHDELLVSRGSAFYRGYDYRVSLSDRAGRDYEALIGVSSDSPVVFVRRAGEDAVYRLEDTMSFYMDQGPAYWAEFRLFAGQFPVETIESVRLEEYREGEWNTVSRLRSTDSDRLRFERDRDESGNADYRANERAIRRVLSLEADGFVREEPDEAVWRITVANRDLDRVHVHVSDKTADGVYPAYVVAGESHLTASRRGPLALRADLFESMLSEMD